MNSESLDLADAIGLLRDQLLEAQRRGQRSELRFGLGEVTVELEVELTRSRQGNGGLRFGVIEAGGSGERASRSSHRLVVTLVPKASGGGDVEVADLDA